MPRHSTCEDHQLIALTGACIVMPDAELVGRALIIAGDRIADICVEHQLPPHARTVPLPGCIIAPGFIDTQVNGGGGVLFNDMPTPQALTRIFNAHRAFGTTAFLPTLISDSEAVMLSAMAAVRQARADAMPGVLGLHLEGPFLNPARRGIHDDAHFRPLDTEWLGRLTSADVGSLLVTLAPEEAPPGTIEALTAAGVRVAAGHTAADYDCAKAAIASGLSGFTHLFNAMPPMLSRAPGPVAAALESDAWCMLIADGHHVHDAMLALVHRAKSDGRVALVTDAMGCVGSDQTEFLVGRRMIRVEGGRCHDVDGTLAGSALTMIDAVRHMHRAADLALHEAVRMASHEPAAFLGLDGERGALLPGLRADMVLLDPALQVIGTVLGGDVSGLSPRTPLLQ